jgi:hypothetical protein
VATISQTYATKGAALERVRYFPRQLITADDMLAEQQHFRQKLRRHNRFLHGWGVVCGLNVTAAPGVADPGKPPKWPWRVKVSPGYALSPHGDEIYVAEPVCLDLATCLNSQPDPCEAGEPRTLVRPETGKLYVAVRYVECETRPQRVHPLGCDCEDVLCEYSRIRDDFEIGCLPENPPEEGLPLICELLGHESVSSPECPECPDSSWVVLAVVTLPKEANTAIAEGDINNSARRPLFSTTMLQRQLIACCCEEVRTAPPDLILDISVSPANEELISSFGIHVKNVGLGTAHSVTVNNRCPASGMVIPKSFKAAQGTWQSTKCPTLEAFIGDMKHNESASLQFDMKEPRGELKVTVSSTNSATKSRSITVP